MFLYNLSILIYIAFCYRIDDLNTFFKYIFDCKTTVYIVISSDSVNIKFGVYYDIYTYITTCLSEIITKYILSRLVPGTKWRS